MGPGQAERAALGPASVGFGFIGEGGGCSSPAWVPHASLDTDAMSHPSAENAHQQPCEVSSVLCGSSDGACVGSSPRDTEEEDGP